MSRIIVVNKKDEFVCHKERDDRNKTDIIRVSGLLLINPKNETLIAQRALSKVHDPGKWGTAVAGTVEEGETYISNIIKEAEEEIGLKISEKDLISGDYGYVETSHKYFRQLFYIRTDLPISSFKIDQNEVAEIRWVPISELLKLSKEKPKDFIASFPKIIGILSKLGSERSQ